MRKWKGKLSGKMETIYGILVPFVLIVLLLASSLLIISETPGEGRTSVGREIEETRLFDGSRVENIDIRINFYGIKESLSYYPPDMDYTLFCDVRNVNDTDVQDVLVTATIYYDDNGTEAWNGTERIDDIESYHIESAELDPWHPMVAGTYRIRYEIDFATAMFSDPNLSNNVATKNIDIEDKVDISIESLEIFPDQENFTLGKSTLVNVTVKNNALTNATFPLYISATCEGANRPHAESTEEFTLTASTVVTTRFNYNFTKVSIINISAAVLHNDNENPINSTFILVNCTRMEPPVPVIVSPVSNYPPVGETLIYFSDEPIRLDGSGSTKDENATELTYLWTSNLTGEISGMRIEEVYLDPGLHEITLEVSDGIYTRKAEIIVKVSERDDAHTREGKIVDVRAEYVGGEDVSVEISDLEKPGAANPPGLVSLNFFRTISVKAKSLPESVLWINISMTYQDYMDRSGEIVTDEDTITAYILVESEDGEKWEKMGKQELKANLKSVWQYIPEPKLTTKIGLFSDTELTVAKLVGKVYSWNPGTQEKAPLPDASLYFDRGYYDVKTDANGRYNQSSTYTKEFSLIVAKSGYTSVETVIMMEKGKKIYKDFTLKLVVGGVNGSVVDGFYPDHFMAGVEVSLIPLPGQEIVRLQDRYEVLSNESGNFTFENLPVGRYELALTPQGEYLWGGVPHFSVMEDEATEVGFVEFWPENHPPKIKLVDKLKDRGIEEDLFWYIIEYSDPDGHEPGKIVLMDSGQEFPMRLEDPGPYNYTLGVRYNVTWWKNKGEGGYTYTLSFKAEDIHGEPAPPIPDENPYVGKELVHKEKKNTILYVVGAIVIVLVLAVVGFLLFRGEKEEYFCPDCGSQVSFDDFECTDCGEELPDFSEMDEDEEEEEEEEEDEEDYDSYSSIRSLD